MLPHCLLTDIVAGEKSAVTLIFAWNLSYFFPLWLLLRFFSLWLMLKHLGTVPSCFLCLEFLELYGSMSLWFSLKLKNVKLCGKFPTIISSNIFFLFSFSLLSSKDSNCTYIRPLQAHGWSIVFFFSLCISFCIVSIAVFKFISIFFGNV